MRVFYELDLQNFEPWSGAVDTMRNLTYDQIEQLDGMLEDIFGEECDETAINDFLWFENDTIAEMLGFSDWEELERSNNGEIKRWNVYKVAPDGTKELLTSEDTEDDADDYVYDAEEELEDGYELEVEEEWMEEN